MRTFLQAGLGDAEDRLAPTSVAALAGARVSAIACGAEYTLALSRTQQRVYSWGWCVHLLITSRKHRPQPSEPESQCSTESRALSRTRHRVHSWRWCWRCMRSI